MPAMYRRIPTARAACCCTPPRSARWRPRVEQKGLTVVPVRMYFKQGKVKMEIALGRGKKLFDHRETLKRRAEERDAARDLA